MTAETGTYAATERRSRLEETRLVRLRRVLAAGEQPFRNPLVQERYCDLLHAKACQQRRALLAERPALLGRTDVAAWDRQRAIDAELDAGLAATYA